MSKDVSRREWMVMCLSPFERANYLARSKECWRTGTAPKLPRVAGLGIVPSYFGTYASSIRTAAFSLNCVQARLDPSILDDWSPTRKLCSDEICSSVSWKFVAKFPHHPQTPHRRSPTSR